MDRLLNIIQYIREVDLLTYHDSFMIRVGVHDTSSTNIWILYKINKY